MPGQYGGGYSNPSVMKHKFSQVPRAEIPRSTFDRSHGYKTAFDAGYLIPVFIDEALPGDTFSLRLHALARLATPIFPLMDNMYLDSFFFSVPYRLVWDNFQKFQGEQVDPGDSTDFLLPVMPSDPAGYAVGSLHDYMGIPTGVANSFDHSSLWHRAYNLIWNSWFRDQNMQDSVVVDRDDGPDDPADYVLLRRGKRHDYFTSCLPWPQKGDAVSIPLGTTATIKTNPTDLVTGVQEELRWRRTDTGNYPGAAFVFASGAAADGGFGPSPTAGTASAYVYPANLFADLTNATAATINSLRQAFQIQKIFERDARGGTRYTEIVRAHFGVTSPDARLQRPEYLGGGSTPINVTPVPNTSATGLTGSEAPQGSLAGVGVGVVRGHGFTAAFTEHCLVIGLVSVRADLTYQQGLPRMFSRRTRFDMFMPALSHIGEQAVLQKEIFTDGTANDDIVFGYQERFAEYRYKPSQITGVLRSTAAGSLDAWHLSQEFGSAPTLNSDFIVENPPIDRVIAVDTEPHFIFDAYMKFTCARPMPVYGVPGLIDHF